MERPRGRPLAIPAKYAAYVAADRDHVAVATLTGATLCVDARYQESAQDFRDFADGRFFGYAWFGYEANGFQLFDRAGKGTAIDTGAEPVFSPAGKRFGSVEWSESGFGALNAVLVMQVLPDGLKELRASSNCPNGPATGGSTAGGARTASKSPPSPPRTIPKAARSPRKPRASALPWPGAPGAGR
jgi:hypothetical protein